MIHSYQAFDDFYEANDDFLHTHFVATFDLQTMLEKVQKGVL